MLQHKLAYLETKLKKLIEKHQLTVSENRELRKEIEHLKNNLRIFRDTEQKQNDNKRELETYQLENKELKAHQHQLKSELIRVKGKLDNILNQKLLK
ncbi:MAG: hypothetical protein KDD94_11260 [Calditrichaeota bacterium]|nr:hypothetical protein [Calditrichota bacterium]